MTTNREDLAAHVGYFASLIAIYEFYEHTGLPAPGHVKDLLLSAQSRMEELCHPTEESTADETRHPITNDDSSEAGAFIPRGEPGCGR